MKLRVIQQVNAIFILCPNGSMLKADKKALGKLLTNFRRPKTFKGHDGYWNAETSAMEDVSGVTLAFVDDANKLVILSDKLFAPEKQIVYVSATEYAEIHGKCRATVKKLCKEGRLEGAYKTSSGWLIPKDAPYPDRKIRISRNKESS